jgi:hypothetical protein
LIGIGDVALIDGRPPALQGEAAIMPVNDNRVSCRLYTGVARVAAHPRLVTAFQSNLQPPESDPLLFEPHAATEAIGLMSS